MLPRDLQGKVGRARKVRGEAEVLQREAAIASAEVAADLVQTAHLTVRDAGRVLGLSRHRIIQLLKAASEKASARMGVAFALLAPADPRAIAALDHAGTPLDDLHCCSTSCSNPLEKRRKSGRRRSERWTIRTEIDHFRHSGREFAEFGTVRPRVQIPGARPICIQNRRFQKLSGANNCTGDYCPDLMTSALRDSPNSNQQNAQTATPYSNVRAGRRKEGIRTTTMHKPQAIGVNRRHPSQRLAFRTATPVMIMPIAVRINPMPKKNAPASGLRNVAGCPIATTASPGNAMARPAIERRSRLSAPDRHKAATPNNNSRSMTTLIAGPSGPDGIPRRPSRAPSTIKQDAARITPHATTIIRLSGRCDGTGALASFPLCFSRNGLLLAWPPQLWESDEWARTSGRTLGDVAKAITVVGSAAATNLVVGTPAEAPCGGLSSQTARILRPTTASIRSAISRA